MTDFFTELRDAFMARLRNPFIACFLLAWPVWNFRLFMVLVGKGDFQQKLDYIDKHLQLTDQPWLWLFGPLVTAAGYTLVWPWFDTGVKVYQLWQENLTVKAELALKKKIPLSPEDQAAWFTQFETERRRLEDALKGVGEQLKREKADLQKELDALKRRRDVQALARLSDASGLSVDVVEALLRGRQPPGIPEDHIDAAIGSLKLDQIRPLSRFILATDIEKRGDGGEVVLTENRLSRLMGHRPQESLDLLEAAGLGYFDRWKQFLVDIEGNGSGRQAIVDIHRRLDENDFQVTQHLVKDIERGETRQALESA